MSDILDQIGDEVEKGWSGEQGKFDRLQKIEFIKLKLLSYSQYLEMDMLDLLRAFEKARNVNCMNWYQEYNFPDLLGVTIVKNKDEFLQRFPSKKFCCPFCSGETSKPQECNSGLKVENIKGHKKTVCNWKSYGLFGTMGKGIRVLVVDEFLAGDGRVHEIFSPIELFNANKKYDR